jgi:hypothetical protein
MIAARVVRGAYVGLLFDGFSSGRGPAIVRSLAPDLVAN